MFNIPSVKPSGKLVNQTIEAGELETYLYKKLPLIVDISFKGAFVSKDVHNFNNYLQNQKSFASEFADMQKLISKLSEHTAYELIRDYKHCHEIHGKEYDTAQDVIQHIYSHINYSEDVYIQQVKTESLYQLGFEGSIRLIGTLHGNVFRLMFVDWYHSLYYAEKYNKRNLKQYKYSLM